MWKEHCHTLLPVPFPCQTTQRSSVVARTVTSVFRLRGLWLNMKKTTARTASGPSVRSVETLSHRSETVDIEYDRELSPPSCRCHRWGSCTLHWTSRCRHGLWSFATALNLVTGSPLSLEEKIGVVHRVTLRSDTAPESTPPPEHVCLILPLISVHKPGVFSSVRFRPQVVAGKSRFISSINQANTPTSQCANCPS